MKKTTSWDYAPENYSKEKASALVTKQNRFSLKFLMLLLLFVGVSVSGWGQTTIVSDGLNNSSALFTLSNGNYYTTNSASGDRPASTPFYVEGTASRGVNNGTATLTSKVDINTSAYTDIQLSFILASFSISSTGNGADAGDIITVEVSPNSGTTWYSTLRVLGNNNAFWGYSATGIASTVYDGNATPVDFSPGGGGSRTTDGYSTVTITSLPATTNLRIKITMVNNANGELWVIDDFKITGILSGTPDVLLSNNGTQVTTSNVNQGTTAYVLHKFQLSATEAAATLTGLTCSTTGTYIASDVTNFKLRYSTDATLDAGDATLSTLTNPDAAGTKTFASFSRSIAKDATGYFFITADVAANATHNNTIGIEAITTDNLTFSSGNKSGSTNTGGLQTFKDVTAPTVSSFSPTDGNTSVTANQNLVITFNENVIAGTEGTFDIYNSSGLLESIPYNDGRITFLNNTVTINPNATFALGANYYVNISANAIVDNAGNAYAGISNNTTWNFTTTKPTVSVVSSTNDNGTYKVGDVITVTVTFNETVFVTNNPRVTLSLGTNRFANYSTGSGTNTLSFTYTLQSGDNSTDLNYVTTTSLGLNGDGTIRTADGIDATLTLPATSNEFSLAGQKAIVVDCVGPTVSSFNPTAASTSVTVNQNLIITFNENIKVGTSGSVDIYNTEGLFESIPYNDERLTFSTNTLTINPTGIFAYSSDYYVQISASVISDLYDNTYVGINNTTTWNFKTECGPVSLPYNESFTNYLPNTCWSEKTGLLAASSTLTGTSSTWDADGFGNIGSTGSARLNIWGTGKYEWLITPTIDLGNTTDYQLEFDLALTTYNATTNPATTGTDDKFAVVISTDNGATWTSANTLRIWNNSGSSDVYNNLTPAGTHVTISLADYTGWVKIGFYGESTVSNADNDLFIDNLSVVQLATCITPTVVASSDVTAISATISWVASSSNPANGYQYELRTSGAAGSGTTGLVTSGTTAAGVVSKAITDLVPNTAYNVFVRSDCGAGDFSAWTSVYSFSTPNLAAPTATAATAITTTGFTANWGAVASATGYELDVYQGGDMLNEDFSSISTGNSTSTSGSSTAWTGNTNFPTSSIVTAYQAGGAVKIGSGSAVGSITTKELNLSSGATLTFDVKGWTTVEGDISVTVNGVNAQTVSYTATISDAFETKTLSIAPNTSTSKVTIATTAKRAFIDNVVVSNKTSVSGAPFTVTETSKTITGLTANSAYYYTVNAKNGSAVSANSNIITAFTAIDGDVSASAMPDCPTCDVTVAEGGTLTLNASKTYNSVTVAPGAKLTLQNGFSLSAPITLQSNASGTATFVDARTHANKTNITATVQQHLPAATDRTWWYLASPVTGAASSVFGSNKVGDYSETTRSYSNPFTEATTLTAGKGYVVKMTNESAANYVFTNKTLNTGDISVALTRTVTETPDNAKRGFNLVGNPYPSYIDWDYVYLEGVNVRPTIWYRTLNGASMEFHTYNAELGVGSPTSASEYIPPMQAFWVKVDKDPTVGSVSNGTLNFTNDMRSHDESVDGNPLKTPAADRNLVRLSISNGTLSDETVIATHPSASDSYDRFDSEKMTNGDTNRPEIFSMAGSQELVINGISPLTDSKQIALGVRPGRAGNYTISLTEWRNTGNMEAVLRDNQLGEELILTESSSYSFDTDGNASTSRFSLLFRAKGSTTGFDRISSDLLIYSTQNTIRVESASLEGNTISIFNALGQPVFNGKAQSNRVEINGLTPAVYMVKVNNQTKMVIVK